ncbi:TAF5-like RNA polymerase II p300/CBP-associated factor-associated factor 65 kDa subunit 5L [Anneissia japonica]|uniref:TAF5-like RNA polymerase II p300/CBP-associated factor-associated factor 65 kDa subunit 5L n=1 Tax=Anneissia japonica TaxID=1529436 RepID=UPI0014254F37|nr:TAF5-like RNA polymerase II p300/CBP-associated factor-associated factor 65 kDa subunit 5L [Anneissia japonica]
MYRQYFHVENRYTNKQTMCGALLGLKLIGDFNFHPCENVHWQMLIWLCPVNMLYLSQIQDIAMNTKSIFLEKDSLSIGEKNITTHINNKHIFRSIIEWFKTWTVWQRKFVLCGVTDRCSNTQLQYILTALEPVFHRDFRNALTGNYPICKSQAKSLNKHPLWAILSPNTVAQNKTLESFVYDYVKNIVASAQNRASKSYEGTVSDQSSIQNATKNDEMLLKMGDKFMTTGTEDKQKCQSQKKAIPDLDRLVEESMDSFGIDWREAYCELKTIVGNLKMTYYHSSDDKVLRMIDVLTPARITPPEEVISFSSSSESSSLSSESPDERQRSTVVDLPIQQVEVFKKESSPELPEINIPRKESDFNHYPCSAPPSPKLQSKSKLEVKEEEKKIVKKKKRKPKKPKEDKENLALDIRPDHEQAKCILIAGHEGLEEERMEGDILTRHLNKVSRMVRAVKRVRRLQGHSNAVCCLKFDRRRIVTGSYDHSIRVWDIRSGRSIHKIYGHKGGVRCIEFNDQWIISGSWDSTIMIWDVVKFTQVAVLYGHTDVVSTLQLIGLKYLVTGSHDKTIRLWCLQDFTLIRILTTHTKSVTCLVVDGENVISGSTDGLIKITQISDGKVVNTFNDQTDPIATLAAQRNLILGGTTRGKAYFWDKLTGELQAAVQLHETIIHKIAFLPYRSGDARFLTTSGDTSIKEWDLYTMTCVRALQGHKGAVRDVQVTEDRIVSCSDDGNVRIWDLMTPQFKPGDKADEDTIETRTINQREDKKHLKI